MRKLLRKPNIKQILKYSVAALIFAVPLYPKFPFISVPGTFVSIRLEDFLILAVSIIWFIRILPNIKAFFRDRINRSIFLFLSITLVSLLFAILITGTVVPHIGLLHWARRFEYFMAFFIGVTALTSRDDLAFYLKCILIVFFVIFIYGVGQKFYSLPIVTTQNLEYSKGIALIYTPGGHLPSTFAGHYDMASFLVLTLPIFFAILFGKVRLKNLNVRAVVLPAVIFGFWLLVNAASRISFVSYLMGVTLVLFFIRKYKLIPVVLVLSIIFGGLSGSLVSRYVRVIEVTVKNLMSATAPETTFAATEGFPTRAERTSTPTPAPVFVFEDRSTSIRFNVEWPRALRAFSKNPLLGTGVSSITLATDNDYLRLLGEVGALGFLAFFLIIFLLMTKFLKAIPYPRGPDLEDAYLVGIVAAIPGVLLNAVFIDVFEASKFAIMFWLLMGFAVSSIKLAKK